MSAPATSRSRNATPLGDEGADGPIGVAGRERDRGAVAGDHLDGRELGQPRLDGRRVAVQHEADGSLAYRRLERRRRAVGDDAAVVEDDDAVGDLVGLVEIVGGEQHRPTLGRGAPHVVPERPAALDIHRDRRLVEEHEIRVARDRHREPDALRLAAGQRLDPAAGERHEACTSQHGLARHRRRRQRPREIDELADARPDGEPAGLEHRADPTRADGRARLDAERPDAPARRVEEAEHQPDRGALAGPVPAEERDGLALLDREAAVVQRDGAAEPAGCAVQLDGMDGCVQLRGVGVHGPRFVHRTPGAKSRPSRPGHDSRHGQALRPGVARRHGQRRCDTAIP